MKKVVAAPVAVVLLAVGGVLGGWRLAAQASDQPNEPAAASDAALDVNALLKRCPSGMTAGGDIDLLPPASEADVRDQGWALTPREAAERLLASPYYRWDSKEKLTVQAGEPSPVTGSESANASQFRVVDDRGGVRGYITVSAVGYGAYAAASAELCS